MREAEGKREEPERKLKRKAILEGFEREPVYGLPARLER